MKAAVRQAVQRPREVATVVEVPEPSIEVFDEVEQGSDAWRQLRLGLPTASEFSKIVARGKDGGESEMRRKLLNRLAGEILTGEPAETYNNGYMERGKTMEAEARERYAFTSDAELTQVGFVRRTVPRKFGGEITIGCSPDCLVGDDGALEIKTMMPALLIDVALRGTPPPEHRAQCQGTLLVTGRKWIDLMIFYRGMPVAPTYRIVRDEHYLNDLVHAIEVFDFDLRKLVEKIRSMGR